MEQRILEILENGESYSVKDLKNIIASCDISELEEILSKLTSNLDIYKNSKNKYTLFSNSNLKKGTLSITRGGIGFVNTGEDNDIHINSNGLSGAIDGDIVAVQVTSTNHGRQEGKIVKIASRSDKNYIGEIVVKKNKTFVVLDDKSNINLVLENSDVKLVDGTKVVLSLKNRINKDTFSAEIKEVLGHKNDPGVDLLSIVKKHNVETEFPSEVLEEVKEIPSELTEEEINQRISEGFVDLRNERIVTIDGEDAKDIDDAISIKVLSNGNFQLSVYIADVSYYVKPGTNLFDNAIKRGTSIYMPGSSIPMLSRELSNGICSLNPDVDRFALTFQTEINKTGKEVDFNIFESVIKSKKQMTYNKVNDILDKNIIPEGYEEFKDDLCLMNELAQILRKKRVKRGFIDFGIEENKIEVDENGKTISVELRKRCKAEKLIEDFMVETGENASIYLNQYNLTHVYRVHGEPKEEKIYNIKQFLSALGYRTDRLDDLSPENIQKLLEELSTKKEYPIISKELLKCMQKACYSTKNIGHFALASESTCQVTSPIRRAGDLINHVLIKQNIYQKKYNCLTSDKLQQMCIVASSTERTADCIEKDSNNMKMAEYMEKYIGCEYEGIITGLSKFGMFIELPNLVEGFVNRDTLTDDNYVYDKEKYCFIGKTNHQRYRLGDKVNIKVVNANKGTSKVDFIIQNSDSEKVKKIYEKI